MNTVLDACKSQWPCPYPYPNPYFSPSPSLSLSLSLFFFFPSPFHNHNHNPNPNPNPYSAYCSCFLRGALSDETVPEPVGMPPSVEGLLEADLVLSASAPAEHAASLVAAADYSTSIYDFSCLTFLPQHVACRSK